MDRPKAVLYLTYICETLIDTTRLCGRCPLRSEISAPLRETFTYHLEGDLCRFFSHEPQKLVLDSDTRLVNDIGKCCDNIGLDSYSP